MAQAASLAWGALLWRTAGAAHRGQPPLPPKLTLGLRSPETAAGGRGGRGGRLDLTAPLLLHPRSQEWEQTWGSWKIPETSVARREGGVNVSKKAWAVLGWSPH